MNLVKDRDYWLEHPNCGTMKAKLIIASSPENKSQSLGFMLPDPVLLPTPGGSFGVSSFLPLIYVDGIFTDIVSRTPWKVMEDEPAVKIPTK
jgi:hypothetical protein